eukprot:gene3888-12068_t
MAAKAAKGRLAGLSPGDIQAKMLTMMRPGELFSLDEEQRIAIFEMVKDGSITIEEAHAEVKRTNPKSYDLKYCGSAPAPAPSLKPTLTQKQGEASITHCTQRLKKLKEKPCKARLHLSTVGVKIQQLEDVEDGEVVIVENEPMPQIAYVGIVPGDKKKVAYVTSYSKLGLVWVHVFQAAKSAEALEVVEALQSRKDQAAEQKSKVPATGIEEMSAGFEEDDEDDESGVPIGAFHVQYLGNVSVSDIQGDEIVPKKKKSKLKGRSSTGDAVDQAEQDELEAEGIVNLPTVLVVSSEGIRTVDDLTHELLYNVIIKAVSYSTEIVGKKVELFAFIEVDDRRNTRTCHVYMCEKHGGKGQALKICDAVCQAFKIAVAEAKARAGNPLLPMGVVREKVEGPLAAMQIDRKPLVAIKAIGAGQFGKVYLATVDGNEAEQRAIKMLRSGAAAGDRQEFLREAETQLTLGKHPNLVEFIGVAVKQRPWLVVLEFCQYGDLSDVLKALARRAIGLTLQEHLHMGHKLPEVLRMVRGGVRLQRPRACPEWFFTMMQSCWNINRHERPTFATLLANIQGFQAANPGAKPRDTGELLNKDLSRQIRQTSVRIRKKGKAAPGAGGRDESGLTGAVDLSGQVDASSTKAKSMAVTAGMAATLDAVALAVPDPELLAAAAAAMGGGDDASKRNSLAPSNGF